MTHEYRLRHKDGHYVWISDELIVIRDSEEKPIEILGYFTDISQRKQTEQELFDSEAKLQAILNYSPSVIYVKDLQGKHILVNQAFLDCAKCKADDILGKTDKAIFPPEMANVIMANDQQLIESGGRLQFEETVLSDGEKRHFYRISLPFGI